MILRSFNFEKFEILQKRMVLSIFNLINKSFFRINLKNSIFFFSILVPVFFQKQILSAVKNINFDFDKETIKWKKLNTEKQNKREIFWEKIESNNNNLLPINENLKYQDFSKNNNLVISSFNRSVVFNDSIIGPDVSWLVPLGFKWNNKYRFDASTRGHSRRKKGEKFLGWNKGDAVGQFNYQKLDASFLISKFIAFI